MSLLRDDRLRSIAPPDVPIGSLLPLDPVSDLYEPAFLSGDLDREVDIVGDPNRPQSGTCRLKYTVVPTRP